MERSAKEEIAVTNHAIHVGALGGFANEDEYRLLNDPRFVKTIERS